MPFDPNTTALLLIEFQNDFMSEGGTLYPLVGPVIDETGMSEHTQAVLEAARENNLLVVHAPISFQSGHPEISSNDFGLLQSVKESSSFTAASWGAELSDGFTPDESEVVLEGKHGLDAFLGTNLDFILRSSGIDTVACAGFLTNACIESTARTAYDNSYGVITLTDCMAATSIDAHTSSIANSFPNFSLPMNHRDFIEQISVGEAQAV